jgi:hypothetical protein
MAPLLTWFVAYLLPAAIGYGVVKASPRRKIGRLTNDMLIIPGMLLVSIGISQYCIFSQGLTFPWNLESLWVLAYLAAIVLAGLLLGKFGIVYAISVLIQQLTMLSITFILLQAFPVYVAALLIAPVYTILHRLRTPYSFRIMALFFVWGVASVALFSYFPNLWLIASLHLLFGSLLVKRRILSPDLKLLT